MSIQKNILSDLLRFSLFFSARIRQNMTKEDILMNYILYNPISGRGRCKENAEKIKESSAAEAKLLNFHNKPFFIIVTKDRSR